MFDHKQRWYLLNAKKKTQPKNKGVGGRGQHLHMQRKTYNVELHGAITNHCILPQLKQPMALQYPGKLDWLFLQEWILCLFKTYKCTTDVAVRQLCNTRCRFINNRRHCTCLSRKPYQNWNSLLRSRHQSDELISYHFSKRPEQALPFLMEHFLLCNKETLKTLDIVKLQFKIRVATVIKVPSSCFKEF